MSERNDCILYFTGISKEISILIPKQRGVGYLKSPFGGHHAGRKYKEFIGLNLEHAGDAFDIDGYLAINISLNDWDVFFEEAVKSIMDGILEIFPHCVRYKEIDGDIFWSYIISNQQPQEAQNE